MTRLVIAHPIEDPAEQLYSDKTCLLWPTRQQEGRQRFIAWRNESPFQDFIRPCLLFFQNHTQAKSTFWLVEHTRADRPRAEHLLFIFCASLWLYQSYCPGWQLELSISAGWKGRVVYLSFGSAPPACCNCGLCLLSSALDIVAIASDWCAVGSVTVSIRFDHTLLYNMTSNLAWRSQLRAAHSQRPVAPWGIFSASWSSLDSTLVCT